MGDVHAQRAIAVVVPTLWYKSGQLTGGGDPEISFSDGQSCRLQTCRTSAAIA